MLNKPDAVTFHSKLQWNQQQSGTHHDLSWDSNLMQLQVLISVKENGFHAFNIEHDIFTLLVF